jgi:predicted DCC family thiol-disulfide oxidoreductase YuxK
MTTRPVIFYDADCGFCRWSLSKVLAWDRRRALRPVALRPDEEAGRLLGGMDAESRMASWHLVLPDGSVHSAGDAFAPLLRLLPGGRPLARLAEAIQPVVNAGYRLVAGHRSLLGRLVTAGARRRADARIRSR